MKLISLAATPVAFFLPSRSKHVDAGKLALISMLFTTFFLYIAGYHFPGGASHYPDWANSIVNGGILPPSHAQREVGLPLLYILGGFPFSHSFIGVTLILGLFAILIVLAVYWSLASASPTVAFYMGLVCIITLSPFTFIKFLYPDQAYMFFNLLAVALLIGFLWYGRFRFLYFFTLAAVAASFTRTAGNLMYPVLLTIAFIAVRGRFRHYLACAMIFAAATGAYQWHRYEIFDMRHQTSTPSGKGMQIFYSTYLYLGDFGYRLSPDLGPNTKLMLEKLRQELQPSTRESALIKQALPDDPEDFMEKHVFAYTPEKLYEKITTEPNEEYWAILMAIDSNDQFYLDVAKEIARSYPWYVVQYSARNLWHALFDPGYATTRYNVMGYLKTGNDFWPTTQGWGVRSEDPVAQYSSHADREMQYFPLKDHPDLQSFVAVVENYWVINYQTYIWITSVPIVIAWMGAAFGVLCWAFPRPYCTALMQSGLNKLMAPIIAASVLVIYEDLATSMFSQPVYRYFHLTEPLRLVIAGFGVILLMRVLSLVWKKAFATAEVSAIQTERAGALSAIQNNDLLNGYFGPRPIQLIFLLVNLNVALFGWWASDVIAKTRTASAFEQYKLSLISPIKIISATFGRSCREFVLPPPAATWTNDGNLTELVQGACSVHNVKNNRCTVLIGAPGWGDPAQGCGKDFSVIYECRGGGPARNAFIAAEASGKSVELNCN